jgi:hypothetical protein
LNGEFLTGSKQKHLSFGVGFRSGQFNDPAMDTKFSAVGGVEIT